jgi:HEAT repeat protein
MPHELFSTPAGNDCGGAEHGNQRSSAAARGTPGPRSQVKLIAIDFIKKHKLLRISRTPASTRCCVAAELCQVLGPKAQAALPELAKLLTSGDQRCRIECIQALSAIGPPAFSTLTNALTDRDGNVRVFAIQAVSKFGPPAWPWLTNALGDNVPMARICAAGGLSKAGPEALIRCLQDQDLMVRRSAASALGNLGSPCVSRQTSFGPGPSRLEL